MFVLSSCTVTEDADAKYREVARRVLRNNPETFVAVVGCYAQIGSEALSRILGVGLIIGTDLMAGFSGEIDATFRASWDLLLNSPVSYADISTFSECSDAAAYLDKYPDGEEAPSLQNLTRKENHA